MHTQPNNTLTVKSVILVFVVFFTAFWMTPLFCKGVEIAQHFFATFGT